LKNLYKNIIKHHDAALIGLLHSFMLKMFYIIYQIILCIFNVYLSFIIRNGGATAPQIAKYCLHTTSELQKYNINSISNQLWIEYFASEGTGSFEFDVMIASTGCGGALRGRSREIASPE